MEQREGTSDRRLLLAGLGLAGAAALARVAKAGPLTPPPGPISPTGKSVAELSAKIAFTDQGIAKPRRPLTSCPSSQTAQFVITEPGAYYMTGNVTQTPGQVCVDIQCDCVDLDGDGFIFDGSGGGGGGGSVSCIRAVGRRCIEVYECAFRGWQGCCCDMSSCNSCFVSDCVFDTCTCAQDATGQAAVCRLGPHSEICDCDSRDCVNGAMSVGPGSSIEDCTCAGGSGGGFRCGAGSCCDNCAVVAHDGIGFQCADGCCLCDCECRGVSGGVGAIVTGNNCVLEFCLCVSSTGMVCGSDCVCTDGECIACSTSGLACGDRCTVTRFSWKQVSGPFAFSCGSRCTLDDSDCDGCAVDGLSMGAECSMTDCTASLCPGTAIRCGDGSCISGCEAREAGTGMATGRRCTCEQGYSLSCGVGFSMQDECILDDCDATGCASVGVACTDSCSITDCDCRSCGTGVQCGSSVCLERCRVCTCPIGYHCVSDCSLSECDAVGCTTGVQCQDRCSLTDMEVRSCSSVSCACGTGCCVDRCVCTDGGSHAFTCVADCSFTDCEVSRCAGWAMTCAVSGMSVDECRVVSCFGIDCPSSCCVTGNELTDCDGGASTGVAGGAINCRGPRQSVDMNCCISCRVGILVQQGCDGSCIESNEMTGCAVAGMVVMTQRCLCSDNSCADRPPGAVGFDFGPCAYGPVADVSGGGDLSQAPVGSHHCTNWLY